MAQMLMHEDRLRRVEERMATHEAVCETRYNSILSLNTQSSKSIDDLHALIKDQVRYMLWALIVMAMASTFGRDVVAALVTKYLGI